MLWHSVCGAAFAVGHVLASGAGKTAYIMAPVPVTADEAEDACKLLGCALARVTEATLIDVSAAAAVAMQPVVFVAQTNANVSTTTVLAVDMLSGTTEIQSLPDKDTRLAAVCEANQKALKRAVSMRRDIINASALIADGREIRPEDMLALATRARRELLTVRTGIAKQYHDSLRAYEAEADALLARPDVFAVADSFRRLRDKHSQIEKKRASLPVVGYVIDAFEQRHDRRVARAREKAAKRRVRRGGFSDSDEESAAQGIRAREAAMAFWDTRGEELRGLPDIQPKASADDASDSTENRKLIHDKDYAMLCPSGGRIWRGPKDSFVVHPAEDRGRPFDPAIIKLIRAPRVNNMRI